MNVGLPGTPTQPPTQPPIPEQGAVPGAQPPFSQAPLPQAGPADPPNYAARVPADQRFGTGQTVTPGTQPTHSEPSTHPSNPSAAQEPPQQHDQVPPATYYGNPTKPMPETLVYEWAAPDRPFKPRKKQFFMTAGTIALLVSLIFFFSGQFPLIAVVVAVMFVTYVLYTFPPQTILNQITTYGVRSSDRLYYWEELGRFWFDVKHGQDIVLIEIATWPNRLTLVVGDALREDIEEILSEVLLQEKPPLTPVERAAAWLQEKVPLDLES